MLNRFWDINNNMIKFKVCNIQTLEMACILNDIGIDSIGVHYWEKNHDSKSIGRLDWIEGLNSKEMSKWILTDCYAINTLTSVLSNLPFDTIQFQGHVDSEEFKCMVGKLKELFPQLKIVKSVSSNLADDDDAKNYIKSLNDSCDGILFDTGWRGGTGVENNIEGSLKLSQWCNKHVIIAGGINIGNIENVLKTLKPNAIDVQSGIEDIIYFGEGKKQRVKSIRKIEALINILRLQNE